MINRLKEKEKESNINIMYAALPNNIHSCYIEKTREKVVLINELIKDMTEEERKQLIKQCVDEMVKQKKAGKVNI